MNTIFGNFFSAVGLYILWFLASSNPDTVQLKDLVLLLQAPGFAGKLATLTAILVVLDFCIFSYRPISASEKFATIVHREHARDHDTTQSARPAPVPADCGTANSDYLARLANRLAHDLDHWTPETLATAEMPEIEVAAGSWLAMYNEDSKAGIVAAMRAKLNKPS